MASTDLKLPPVRILINRTIYDPVNLVKPRLTAGGVDALEKQNY
jgi:hypothetical protein